MKIALCGAHRTGKTTLLHALKEHLSMPIVQTQTSQVFLDNGLQPNGTYEFGTKLDIQYLIVDSYCKSYEIAGNNFITDRSPIDALAYTLAEVNNSTDSKYSSRLKEYSTLCINIMKTFDRIFIIPPVIPLVYEENKGAINSAFIEHIHTTLLGLLVHHELDFNIVPAHCNTVNQRISFISEQL